jgi:hypothetical protein
MPSVETQVAALTGMLAAATGLQPRTRAMPGGVRIEADLPDQLAPAARSAILAALGIADSYGHERTPDCEFVWALIAGEQT